MTSPSAIVFLRKALGITLILFSLLGILVGIIAFFDPVGTKMADDNDPFGPPPSRLGTVTLIAFHTSLGIAGFFLASSKKTTPKPPKKNS